MSFLKDFKEELSQAVNELVNQEEFDEEETGSDKDEEYEKLVEQIDEEDDDIQEEEEGITVREETVNTMDDFEENNGIDMKVLNELFGSEETDNESEEEESSEDYVINGGYDTELEQALEDEFDLDNIDLADYMDDEKEEEEIVSIKNEVKEQQDMEESIVNGISEEVEELRANEKEQMRAALRGEKRGYNDNAKDSYMDRSDEGSSALATEEVAEITKGTMIEGNIVSEGSINVYGKIKGNVACRGKMVVCGTIVGSSRAAEVFTNNAKVNGDITSDGSIKIGNGSVIIGNVYGTSAVIAGAVQGDVDIHGPVVIDGTAVVQGNIRSRSVQINNGAAIEGMISQCYAEVDYAALFDKTFSN